MGKVVLFVPFEAVGKLIGGIARGVADGFEVVAEAVSPAPPPIQHEDDPEPERPKVRRTYTMQEGEYLIDVARSELGHASRWPEIMALNNLADSRKIQAGQKLYLPDE